MKTFEVIRSCALGENPKARGGNPISSWVKDKSTIAVLSYKSTNEMFTLMTTIEQRTFLLFVSHALEHSL